jgi:hypothetical protein
MTSLNDLKQMGGFVPDAPIPRDITFVADDGKEYTAHIHVRKLGVGEGEALVRSFSDGKSYSAAVIHLAIRLGDGTEVIPYDLATRMDKGLAKAMVEAFREVNDPKKTSPSEIDSSAT